MKSLSAFSVKYPITILMIVLSILLLGYISFEKLGMDLFPNLNNPKIFIGIKAGERPPEEMEKQFVESIEAIAVRQRNAAQVSSVSRIGAAEITVEYNWDADMDEALLDLQKNLGNFAQNSDLDEITYDQHDPNSAPVMIIGFSHPEIDDMDELRKIAENYIRNELVRLPGIASVEIIGGEEKEIVVETSPYKLEAYNITAEEAGAKIINANRDISGGSIEEMGLKYVIKGIGAFQSLNDIGNVTVARSQQNGAPVYLKNIARIYYKNKEPQNIVRINQKRCIALAIYKETKYNTVKAVDLLTKNLSHIKKALPGYEFNIIQNQAEFITKAIDEVKQTALYGILLAVIILFVFLQRVGVTAIISITIPISIIATFNLMYFNGLTLNIMTLGGLALGAGMLVDNAIVVMENIYRNLEKGLPIKEAAINGTAEVGGAITASTITTIVVFLPIIYLHGEAGELFKDQAWTVAFSLISSLFAAILVIPMLSVYFLKEDKAVAAVSSVRFQWYRPLLEKILQKRKMVLILSALLIIGSALLIPIIGSEFMPKSDSAFFTVELALEEGSALRHTDRAVSQIETLIRESVGDDIENIYSRIGPAGGDLSGMGDNFLNDENHAEISVNIKPQKKANSEKIFKKLEAVFKKIPDITVNFKRGQSELQNTMGSQEAPVVLEIKGEDLTMIRDLSAKAKKELGSVDDLMNIESSFSEGRPEINIKLDRIRAGIYNIDFASVANQLQDYLQGKEAGTWDNRGETHNIMLKLPKIGLHDLKTLKISNGQQDFRLGDIADIEELYTQKEILRHNQVRIGRITAEIKTDRPLDKITAEIKSKMQNIYFPEGYQYQIGGEEALRERSFSNLKFALLLSVILIYMVMASQFESLIHPFTILLTLPLAGVGAVLIFFVLKMTMNVMAYIGIIMLMGIAVNDSIILVDAVNHLKRQGMPLKEAILEAGERRIRPIIMTSLTTILALLPLTIGFGEGAALRAPMAVAVIGGLTTSTLLTLVVIPCLYHVFDKEK